MSKHKNRGKRYLVTKYFKGVQRRQSYLNNWTFFGNSKSKEILICDIQEIKVNRENELKFYPESPNPYNPEDYDKIDSRLKRQIKNDQRVSKLKLNLLRKQDGLCVICGQIINLDEEPVERDHIIPLSEGGADTTRNTVVIHKVCHQQKTSWERKWKAFGKRNK